MPDTLAKLTTALTEGEDEPKPFGPYEEEAIISLALDHPEFFAGVGRFLRPAMFGRLECQWIMAEILTAFDRHGVVPTRPMMRDKALSTFTEDDPFESVLAVIERASNQREVPLVKETLLKWTRDRAYGLLYSEEAQDAYARGDYEHLEQIVNEANRLADIDQQGFWFLEQYEVLFDPDIIDHRTTGFARLDRILNNGGPSPKEVLCWLAATNVGKSILLVNNAVSSLCGMGANGKPGQDVLLITFELDAIKTAMRCLGAATDVPLNDLAAHRDYVKRTIDTIRKTYGKRLVIYEWSPDECSVAHIYALLDNLARQEGWRPDVVVLDYMDLMISRNPSYNKDDYTRQKHVANEIRGLARNENMLVYTATQTNRSGSGGEELADLNKAAESFAKQFALDYVVSLNQSRTERCSNPPRIRFFVAKNRNGPKGDTVTCAINYDTMQVREEI
jgi:hypothetical protein